MTDLLDIYPADEDRIVVNRVRILLPLPVDGPFDYKAPDGMVLDPGHFVEVPFGPRRVNGVVWPTQTPIDQGSVDQGPIDQGSETQGIGDNALPNKPAKIVDDSRLKSVLKRHETPPLSAAIIAFIDWVARYTLFPAGSVLRLVMRNGDQLAPPKGIAAYSKAPHLPPDLRITPKRQLVLDAIDDTPVTLPKLVEKSGVSDAVIRTLAKSGALNVVMRDPDEPFTAPNLTIEGHTLSPAQTEAVTKLTGFIDRLDDTGRENPTTALIDGVTGSGKTEVYLELVKHVLAKDPDAQVLVMLPEIGLTLPFLQRIEQRFQAKPAPWHSDVSATMRRRVWRRVLDGQTRLVVGARSALFLPFPNLKLIIVDEEHDGAYKQEDGVLYQGRDMAVARGAHGKFPVILASATPALETMINAAEERYYQVKLPARFGKAIMPKIALIDMRKTPPEKASDPQKGARQPRWLSPPLVDSVNEALSRSEQSLLFLNRRGYAPLTICRKCGHRMKAPDSDTCLVEHRFENRLVCHHTGYSIPKPAACPQCKAVDGLAACGPGVERIADEARERWPSATTRILSSDRSQSPAALRDLLSEMREGEIDILVATQAAAKGHNFPNLTFVGVVDADLGLSGGDLRAAERTYQVLSQVTGRAGRADKPGHALLQTYQPDAPVLRALIDSNRDAFLAAEAQGRIDMMFPPFGRIASIILRGRDEHQVRQSAAALRQCAPNAEGIEIWGPAPAPLFRLKGQVRIRMLVRARRGLSLQAYLKDWTERVKIPSSVRRTIDVDPYSFM